MEWIPVFSLIVLVATIGTFIMSVSAYVMFKIRESRKRAPTPRQAARVDAEVVAPESRPPSHGMQPGGPAAARGAGQRLVQYTPPAYNGGSQHTGEEPVAFR